MTSHNDEETCHSPWILHPLWSFIIRKKLLMCFVTQSTYYGDLRIMQMKYFLK